MAGGRYGIGSENMPKCAEGEVWGRRRKGDLGISPKGNR